MEESSKTLPNWFVSTLLPYTNKTKKELLHILFGSLTGQNLENIDYIISNNNENTLLSNLAKGGTRKGRESNWKSYTIPAIVEWERDPLSLESLLIQELEHSFWQKFCSDFPSKFNYYITKKNDDSTYLGSRAQTWISAIKHLKAGEAELYGPIILSNLWIEFCRCADGGGFRQDDGEFFYEYIQLLQKRGQLKNNVYFSSRKTIETQSSLRERLKGAKRVKLLNFAGTTLLYEKAISSDVHHKSVREEYDSMNNTQFQIILPKKGSLSEQDAVKYKMREPYDLTDSQAVVNIMRNRLIEDADTSNGRIQARFTECALPYALMIVTYEDKSRDHVKVDLYSPYLEWDSDIRSFIIYREKDPENFSFFESNFNAIWAEGDPTT